MEGLSVQGPHYCCLPNKKHVVNILMIATSTLSVSYKAGGKRAFHGTTTLPLESVYSGDIKALSKGLVA